MKRLIIQLAVILIFGVKVFSQTDASESSTNPEQIGYASTDFLQLTLQSGIINPISPSFANHYFVSGNMGFDLSYRINSEVALYAENKYNFLSSKDSTVPPSGYFESTLGVRYYIIRPSSGRSSVFLEVGVGPYIFVGGASNIPGKDYETSTKIRFGGNTGVGIELVLTNTLFITLKSKLNSVFESKGSTTYITGVGGFTIRI